MAKKAKQAPAGAPPTSTAPVSGQSPPPAATAAPEPPKRYAALLPYTYHYRGEKKTGWTEVGVGWLAKDRQKITLEIRPGLSVQGRLLLKPWEPKPGKPEHGEPDSQPQRFIYDPASSLDDLV